MATEDNLLTERAMVDDVKEEENIEIELGKGKKDGMIRFSPSLDKCVFITLD